jgi:hypothetical protein
LVFQILYENSILWANESLIQGSDKMNFFWYLNPFISFWKKTNQLIIEELIYESSESHKLAASCAALSLKLNFGCFWAYKLELEAQGLRGKRSSRSASSSGFWAWSSTHFKLTLKIISKMDFSQNFTKIFNLHLTRKLLFGTTWANLIQIQQKITEFFLKLSLFK